MLGLGLCVMSPSDQFGAMKIEWHSQPVDVTPSNASTL